METINRVYAHYHEALTLFPENKIIGIFVSGSQNYGLADENSDVDTKLIITPSINDFVFNEMNIIKLADGTEVNVFPHFDIYNNLILTVSYF